MPVIKTLEIDFVEIHPRADVFEHARRAVAVRDVRSHEPHPERGLEERYGPLAGDERLLVRAHDNLAAEANRVLDERGRRGVNRRRNRLRIAERLRRHPVLAVRAVQVAPEHAEAEGERAGMRVEERLLLDRIALDAADVSPRNAQVSAAIEPHLAHADGPVGDRALVPARVAADALFRDVLDELWRSVSRACLENIREGR